MAGGVVDTCVQSDQDRSGRSRSARERSAVSQGAGIRVKEATKDRSLSCRRSSRVGQELGDTQGQTLITVNRHPTTPDPDWDKGC